VNVPSDAKRRSIVMLLYGRIAFDSRVQREAASLSAAGYAVTVCCLPPDPSEPPWEPSVPVRLLPVEAPFRSAIPGAPRHAYPTGGLAQRFAQLKWIAAYAANILFWGRRARHAAGGGVAIWHAHDLAGVLALLPWLVRSRMVYDVHELHVAGPGEWSRLGGGLRALAEALERFALRRAAGVITVNRAVAGELRERYGARRVRIVHNCPPRWTTPTRPPELIRGVTGIPPQQPILLYHGLFAAPRGIRQILGAILEPGLEDSHAVFLGYGDLHAELLAAKADPRYGRRVHIIDAVEPAHLLPWVASADVALMPIQPEILNGYLSTPNKLFEAIAASVPVVVSDFPAMAGIVREAGVGEVCDPTSPADIARAVRAVLLTEPAARDALRARSREAAKRWNWETEASSLLQLYEDVLRD